MARDILIRLNKLTAAGKVPADDAIVRFAPTILRADADGITIPEAFPVELVNGEATAQDVPTTDLNWAYHVQILNGRNGQWSWFVHVPEGTPDPETGVVPPVNFEDLPRIDPATLTPVNDPDPAWVDAVTSVFSDTLTTELQTQVPTRMVAEAEDESSEFRTVLNAASAQVVQAEAYATFRGGTGDQTAALQAFINSIPAGRDAEIRGTVNFTTVTIGTPNVRVRLAPGAVLNKTTADTDGIVVNAANVTLEGGKIKGPASWDGVNTAWTYAMVHVKETTGNNATIRGVTLENVHKTGIGVRADAVNITDCRIIGNYPAVQWTGVETAHFGIALDPTSAGMGGAGIVANNHISGCVQGISLANQGAGVGYGYTITGNSFYGCHNHGIYGQSGIGNTVTGNSFHRCQIPVAMTGTAHVVSGNTLYTSTTGGTLDWAGISLRNPVGCVVEGNTIFGDITTLNVGISLDAVAGTEVRRNVVKGNSLVLNGTGQAAIRVGTNAEVCEDNIVEGNITTGGGMSGGGTLIVTCKVGFTGTGNMVIGNRIRQTGPGNGLFIERQRHAVIAGNHVSLHRDAAATETIVQTYLASVTDSVVRGNTYTNPATSGANIGLRAMQEDATSDRNVIAGNVIKHDTTKLTSSTEIVQNGGAATLLGVELGEYAAATTLGTLTGKVEVRDGKGTIKGYAPVYGSIT